MMRILRALPVGLTAVLLTSAVGSGVALASRPVQPTYTKGGNTIAAAVKVEGGANRPRIWVSKLGFVIKCGAGENSGEIEAKGRGKGKLTYKECGVSVAKEDKTRGESEEVNTKQIVEGESLSKCTVESTGATTGEIKTKALKSRLVWAKGENVILELYEAEKEKEALAELSIKGETCALKGTYKVEGSVLALVTRPNEEEIEGAQEFNTVDGEYMVKPAYSKWEVEEGGKKTEGTAELKTVLSTTTLEGSEELEIATAEETKNAREPFGVHE